MELFLLLAAAGALAFVLMKPAAAAETARQSPVVQTAAAAAAETVAGSKQQQAAAVAQVQQTTAVLEVVEAGLELVSKLVDVRQSNLADAQKLGFYLESMTAEQGEQYRRIVDAATMHDTWRGRLPQTWWWLSTKVARDAYRARTAEQVLGIE